MTWQALFDTTTGRLISLAQVLPGQLPPGTGALVVGNFPDGLMWDEPTRTYVTRPPKVLVDRLADIQSDPRYADFQGAVAALTPAQRQALRAGLIRLLGNSRFRNPAEPVEVS